MGSASFYGNPFLGMYAKANDSICFLPNNISPSLSHELPALETEAVEVSIFNSGIIGLYITINNNGVVLPDIVQDEEIKKFKKSGLNCTVISEVKNAFGNNIAANDKGGVINPSLSNEDRKKAEDCLGVELVSMAVKGYETVGSVCFATNKGFIAHNELNNEELKELEGIFKVKGINGTVNMGSIFVGLGIIANSHGYIVGDNTSGVEVNRIEDALDLIK